MGDDEAIQHRYEAVDPTGPSTVSRLATVAASSGYDGIVLRESPTGIGTTKLQQISEKTGISVVSGRTVTATDRSRAGSEIARLRTDVSVLFGSSTDAHIRHFLAGQERLDVLRIPGKIAGEVTHTTVTRAKAHGIYVEIDLGPLLRMRGGHRVQAITGLRQLIDFVDHYDANAVVTGAPTGHLELRSPRELIGIAETVGFDSELIEDGISAWEAIIERAMRVDDDRFIEPGVEVIPNEANDR